MKCSNYNIHRYDLVAVALLISMFCAFFVRKEVLAEEIHTPLAEQPFSTENLAPVVEDFSEPDLEPAGQKPSEERVATPVEEGEIPNETVTNEEPESGMPFLRYQLHMQSVGDTEYYGMGEMAGFPGQGLRMESLLLEAPESLGLTYGVHVQNIGWQDTKIPGERAGTSGKSLRIEALWVDLKDEMKAQYDVCYRVYVEGIGWLPYAMNGQVTGSEGLSLRMEAFEVLLTPKNQIAGSADGMLMIRDKKPRVHAHVQNLGWLKSETDQSLFGTSGKSLRLEALQFESTEELSIHHNVHVANIGWMGWQGADKIAGTEGKALALEAVQLKLEGTESAYYDLYYRVHVRNLGWMDWAKNGEMAGTTGFGLRMEALEIKVLPKGRVLSKNPTTPSKLNAEELNLTYEAYSQRDGWHRGSSLGSPAGKMGSGQQVEALRFLKDPHPYVQVEMRSFVEGKGWGAYAAHGAHTGTVGEKRKLEAVEMRLTGILSSTYDLYYRVCLQGTGWLSFAKAGYPTGMPRSGVVIEAVEVQVLPKNQGFQGTVGNPYVEYYKAERGTVFYTTQNMALYEKANYSRKIGEVPKASFLTGTIEGAFLKTTYQGRTGYVSSASLSKQTATHYGNVLLVNKKHGLSASFNPGTNHEANQALSRMMAAGSKEGVHLQVNSGYRTFSYQQSLYNNYVKQHGKAAADRFSMRPGFSEHQTGLAFDIGKRGAGASFSDSFGKTREGLWLAANAPRYGFILRYPEGKEDITGIMYEPWHFRYVGTELAQAVTTSGLSLDEFFQIVAPVY